jgi:pantoate--beta-alanine ligase
MITVKTKDSLRGCLQGVSHKSIGFIPTMGALHPGHISLLYKAKAENDLSVVSIFINPTQFNDINDFRNYPKNFLNDQTLLEENACDVLFLPDYQEIYPGKDIEWIDINLGDIEQVMEGKYRSGHFKGVKTVVYNLFKIVNPTRAYFGKKDYQQMLIIMEMVKWLKLPVQIIPCDTQREPDGLAMSSRNRKLNVDERIAAGKIPAIMKEALIRLNNQTPGEVTEWVKEEIDREPLLKLQYLEIVNKNDLMPVQKVQAGNTRIFIAAFAGNIRLIDNMLFKG